MNQLIHEIPMDEFLSKTENRRRVLIVADISRTQELFRRYEAKTGRMVRNINCMTLRQAAEMLYMWSCAKNGHESAFRIIDQQEAMMLFRSEIIKKTGTLAYFNNPDMINTATASELFNIANLVRTNGWNGKELSIPRIDDLKHIISEYERTISNEKIFDNIALYRYIEGLAMPADEIRAIFGADIYYLSEDTETYSGLEHRILLNVLGCSQERGVKLFECEASIRNIQGINGKAFFYKGYGSFNEANYVANDILEKKLSFGNVEVLYSSQTQLPAITAALRGNGISTRIVSGYATSDNPHIALILRLLDWAEDDFNETKLEAFLSSPVLSIIWDDGTKKRNLMSGQRYFDHVLDAVKRREDGYALGWGYERNAEFIAHEEKKILVSKSSGMVLTAQQTEYLDQLTKKLEMHKEALNIFGDGETLYDGNNAVTAKVICTGLLEFLRKYGAPSPEFAVGIEVVSRVIKAAEFDDAIHTLIENIRLIRELTGKISVCDNADAGAVTVRKIGDWNVPDRSNIFVIGLSLKDMHGDTAQSPVLFDNEMTEYLGTGYKPTIENEAERRERNIYRILMLFDGEEITFGYSSYDTIDFCESNPSGLFRDILREFGDNTNVEELSEFVYGNPDAAILIKEAKPVLPMEIEKALNSTKAAVERHITFEGVTGIWDENNCPKGEEEYFEEDSEYDDNLYEDDEVYEEGLDEDAEEYEEVYDEEPADEYDESDPELSDEYDEEYDDTDLLIDYDDENEDDEYEDEEDQKEDFVFQVADHLEVKLNTSNSAIEELLDCPKKYAFDRILHIPDNRYKEKDFERWPDAAAKGSFFHAIAEEYVNQKLKKSSKQTIDNTVDENYVNSIAEKVKTEILRTNPVAIPEMADRETKEMVRTSVKYFTRLQAGLNNPSVKNPWRPVLTEQEFHSAEYAVKSLNKNDYVFILNGFIDRIDYSIDYNNKQVLLRIADYKTGKKDSKIRDNKLGKLIQYAIYEKALMDTGMTADASGNDIRLLEYVKGAILDQEGIDIREFKYSFDSFLYEFPMEVSDTEPLQITHKQLEGINLTRLKSILTMIENYDCYPNRIELFNKLSDFEGYYPSVGIAINELHSAMTGKYVMSQDEAKNCEYCDYKNMCEYGKGR